MGLLMTTMRRASLGDLGASCDDWTGHAEEAGDRYGLDPSVLLSLMFVESSCRSDASGAAGEVGLMQVMPATARMVRPGITSDELRDPATNIDVGADYLATQLARYGGDLQAALSAYNAGTATPRNQSYVDRVLASLGYAGGDEALVDDPSAPWLERAWAWVRAHPYATASVVLSVWLWRRR